MAKLAEIRVEGLKELQRDLRRAGQVDLAKAVKLATRDGAQVVAVRARTEAPRLEGKLAGSIKAGATARSAYIKAGSSSVPYAAVIHFGSPKRGIAPNPYMFRARDAERDRVESFFDQRIDDVLRRLD